MNVRETLIAARALIADEVNWTQGDYMFTNEANTMYCAVGAIGHIKGLSRKDMDHDGVEDQAIVAMIGPIVLLMDARDPDGILVEFNDTHSHAEVLTLFDKAIACAT